jgi:hypothetical protein
MAPKSEGYLHSTKKRGLSSQHQKEKAIFTAPKREGYLHSTKKRGLSSQHQKERAIFTAPKRGWHQR